jgi:hypothetical protein
MVIQSTLATNEMQGPTIQPLNLATWQFLSFKGFNEKTTVMIISKGLVQPIFNEQCLVFFAIGKSSISKIHTSQILYKDLSSNMFLLWVELISWNIVHDPKWKQIDQQILMALI